MAPNYTPGPPLQSRDDMHSKYNEYKKDHDIKDPDLPKCDAKQCDLTKEIVSKMTGSNSDIISNLAGNFGMSQDFWTGLNENIQAYNNDPELNQLIADQQMARDFKQSKRDAESAEKEYNDRLKTYCESDTYKNTDLCKELAALEYSDFKAKINAYKDEVADLSSSIMEWIDTYSAEKLALIRMDDLLTTRTQEFNTDIKDIDNVVTNIQTDSRKGFYEEGEQNFIEETKIYIIFLYYILFLLYLFVSDFFPGQGYKKISNIIMIIVFLAVPFLIQYIVSFVYTFINNILIRFDLKRDDIRDNVLVSPNKN